MPKLTPLPPTQRILKHALAEFSRHGYAGARMERIARLARVNKRMLHYYFKTKNGLFEAVLESAWNEGTLNSSPSDPVQTMLYWNDFYEKNKDWTRLLAWEALEWKKSRLVAEDARKTFWENAISRMRKAKSEETWPQSLDIRHLLLSLIGVEAIHILLPQLAKIIIGKNPASAEFFAERQEFIQAFAEFLTQGRAGTKSDVKK